MTEAILRKVFKFIQSYIAQRHDSPTLREIGEACNLQMGKVLDAVTILEIRGKIEREKGVRRSIRLLAVSTDPAPAHAHSVSQAVSPAR